MKHSECVTRFYLIILAVLCGVLGACNSSAEKSPLPEPSAVVLDGFEQAVIEQIEAAFQRWKSEPLSAQKNGELAMLLHTYLQYSQASVYYQRARQLDPSELKWPYLHAKVLDKLGERDRAIAAYEKSLQLDSSFVPAKVNYAQLLFDAGDYTESRALYAELLKDQPDLPQALYGQGRNLLREGNKAGIELLERAISSKGPYGAAHYALAEAYRIGGQTTKANQQLQLFEKFRTIKPALKDPLIIEMIDFNESTQGLINRGRRRLDAGRIINAIDDFELSLERDSTRAVAHGLLIVCYALTGKFEKAESHYYAGIEIDPELEQLHNNLGTLRLKQGRYGEAAEAYRTAIETNPEYLEAYINLGAVLETSGKRSEAIKQYRTVLARDPSNRIAGFLLGNAYMKNNNPHRAKEYYLSILEPQDFKTPEYLQALAVAHTKTGNNEDALLTLEWAMSIAKKTGRNDLLPKLQAGLQLMEKANAPNEAGAKQ